MEQIKKLKKGTLFTLVKVEATTKDIYVRGSYIPAVKKYSCHKYDDINKEKLFKGNFFVNTDFYTIDKDDEIPY